MIVGLLTLALMVPAQSITVTAPAAGDVLVVGTSTVIQWTAVGVTDVKVETTTDDGASWTTIADTVDTTSADWGSLTWQVPDSPSTTCRIMISDYLSRNPATESGTFEIGRPIMEANEDDGGCAATSGGSVAAMLLFILFVRRRRLGA